MCTILAAAGVLAVGVASTQAGASVRTVAQAQTGSSKITSELRTKLAAQPNAKVRYLVTLAQQANVENNISDWNAKGQYVLDTLKAVANATQPKVRDFLASQVGAGTVDSYKAYYITNAFSVKGNLASAEAIAGLPEVARIEVFPVITLDDETPMLSDLSSLLDVNVLLNPAAASPDAIEWNVNIIRAPQAWALNCGGNPCTGTGITVGSLDTGARYTHVAINSKYRGNLGGGSYNHNYNWWHAVGTSDTPVDSGGADSYHGSHTIGTILGDDGAGNQIGVAPGANWISVNGIAAPAEDADIIEAGQWILAPWDLTGLNPMPSMRPRIASNSWGYGDSVAYPNCSTATFFHTEVQNWVAAGIFPSFSSGNAGPAANNRPPSAYPETFETGSITNSGVISSFSSRGPSCYDGGQHPQVVAGGSNVRSVDGAGDTGYKLLNGTSMSQPATAGSVAVLLQANPNLTIPQIWYILTSTAYMSPTWGAAPNMTYGWGLIQLDAAVMAAQAMGPTPTPVPPTATVTPVAPTATPTTQPVITPTATVCTILFTDVPVGSTFYPYVTCMACRGIINGYDSGCETGNPCFRPSNNVTRGQLSKIVSNAAGFNDTPTGQQFEDVAVGSTFYDFVWRLADRNVVSGYACGGPGEPCGGGNLPYFRPNNNVTRGQMSKIVSEAAQYSDTPGAQQFEDVAPGSTFYDWIWRLASRNIMGGYACGGPGEPCGGGNLPYFRPGNTATRGQASKVVSNTFFPECTPSR